MNEERFLLETGCKYSTLAYNEEVKKGIKIESRLTSTTAYVVKTKTLDIICFRGTQQLGDWLFNISAIPVPYAGRLCHGGFVAAHASVWRKIKKHIDYDKDTLICGHSLGGVSLHKKHNRLSLVTFGKPNTFFKGFKRPMNLVRQISLVSGSDVVARIPRLCYGASVSQKMIYFANNGKDIVNPTVEFKKKDFMRNKGEAISDHFMPGYEQRLCNFIENIGKKKRQSQTSTKSVAAKGESGLTKEEERELKKLIGEDIYD
jgi:hypothetical protein